MAQVIPETYNPRSMLQKAQLEPEDFVTQETLWLCAWCYRCTERCPQGIQPTEIFLMMRNYASEEGNIPENPNRIIKEIIKSGRSMPYDEFIDELRQDYGLPTIGPVPERVLEEQLKIMGEAFQRRIEK